MSLSSRPLSTASFVVIFSSVFLLLSRAAGAQEGATAVRDQQPLSSAANGNGQPATAQQREPAARAYPATLQHKPTPLPDRVVLTWSGDPTRSIDISWRTDLTARESAAEVAQADSLQGENLDQGDERNVRNAQRVEGGAQEFTSDLGKCRLHSVHLGGLQPATMYAYRVGGGKNWSEWFQFRTASASDEPFTFVYFGDAQNDIRSLWSRVIREANQHAPRAAFMLHAGDLVSDENSDAHWGEWFYGGGWLNGMIPTVATPGNHEYDDDDQLSRHWRPQFVFPTNGPSGLEETVYWLDYQGARIISLNSNERIEEQAAWLKPVLSDSTRPKWTIVTFHHPIFSASQKDRDNPELRAAWRPLFEEFGVDLVLQGHDHSYARTGLGGPTGDTHAAADSPSGGSAGSGSARTTNVPEGVRRTSSNTVYVVSVSGPKHYYLQRRWKVSREASGAQLFQVIHVSPAQIRYEARLATGELYDAFTLAKGEDGKSVMTEQIPAIDEIDTIPVDEDD
jgi:3',5'-cyclic AMP phosphodiesterase CpdA